MMTTKEFTEKMLADAELATKLSKAASPDEAYAIAKDAGLDATMDDFMGAMKKMNEAANEMNANDVDAIVGGSTTTAIVSAVASTAGAASAIVITSSASGAAV